MALLRVRSAVALSAILMAAGCGGERRLNVVIVTIDTCRADHLGVYGNEAIKTPNIDALAADGVLFEHAFTPVPITLPSHTTIMTGTYPQFHGTRDNDMFVDDAAETLAEVLAAEGYATGAFVSAYPLHRQFNLAQGFEAYDDAFESDDWRFLNRPFHENFFFDERTADGTTLAALDWLDTAASATRPFFLWTHYFDPHANYQPPAPFDQIYAHNPYDGEIANVDRALGRLISRLRDAGVWDDTVFVLTADHGESLNEHQELTHALLLYDTTLHVPLIVRAPGRSPARFADTVRTLDILPTVLDLLGIDAPQQVQGTSLRPLVEGTGEVPELEVYHESFYTHSKFGWSPLRAFRRGADKLIEAPRPELYAWREDQHELDELAAGAGERVEALRADLYRTLQHTKSGRRPQTRAIDAETRAKLESLGYLGSSPANPGLGFDTLPAEGPSPMAMMPVWQRYNRVKTLIRDREPRWELILAELRRLIEEDEGSGDYARYLQALSYLALEDFDQARKILEERHRQGDADYAMLLELAALKLKSGEDAAARALLLETLALRPEEPLLYFYLGWAAERQGDVAQAEQDYRQALDFDPEHSQALVNLGNLLSEAKRYEAAGELLEQAAASTPYRAEVHYNLGVLRYRQGQDLAARDFFQRAVKIDPLYGRARYALARTLETLGDADGARREARLLATLGTTDEALRDEVLRMLEPPAATP